MLWGNTPKKINRRISQIKYQIKFKHFQVNSRKSFSLETVTLTIISLLDLMESQNLLSFDNMLEYLRNYLMNHYGNAEKNKKCLKHKFLCLKFIKQIKEKEIFLKYKQSGQKKLSKLQFQYIIVTIVPAKPKQSPVKSSF